MTRSHIEHFAKYAGVLAVVTEWLALLLYYLKAPSYFNGKYAISYFATLEQTRLIFNICYTLATLFFLIFVKYHLNKHYPTPIRIFLLSGFTFVGLALAPFVPNNLTSRIIHDVFAWSTSILFAIGIYIMAKNSNNKLIYRMTFTTIILSGILSIAFVLVSRNSYLVFIFEAGSWLIVQFWVLWISYYTYKV